MGPNECKYCGCDKFNADSVTMTRFRCGSTYWPPVAQANQDEVWQIANGCAARCAVQLVELREQVQRAVEVLDDITSDAWEEGLQDATRFLRGNSPESPDSSPVTADDLAVADYYEAVRQRVPWMTSVQHIEQLVDGYRQCGLMVWKAAKHIEDLFGGEHGQTK